MQEDRPSKTAFRAALRRAAHHRPLRRGDDVKIGPAVQIYTAQHPTDPETRRSGLESALPITIGDNAWIGGGAILCPGVTIGTNTWWEPAAW